MKYINELHEGTRVKGVYLCKNKVSAMTKNGKNYESVTLQDKTGSIDAKIWNPNSPGISEYDVMDYVDIVGDVTSFAGSLQISIQQLRVAEEDEYNPGDYLPVSKNSADLMYDELVDYIKTIQNPYLKQLLVAFFVQDTEFIKSFKNHSAAKTVHHSFVGGLLEHTLSVVRLCDFYAKSYKIINRDLLLTAAMCHDIGKTKEISAFPVNDYTDEGQLLGHIMMGAEMIHDMAKTIPDFPVNIENELKHCILAHHGELEYGSPKKPALVEAAALNLADNTDARMETLTEIFESAGNKTDWLGYNRIMESNIRKTNL